MIAQILQLKERVVCYLNMWYWARTKKYKLSSQLQCAIYCMSNKMYTLLWHQSRYAANLFTIDARILSKNSFIEH